MDEQPEDICSHCGIDGRFHSQLKKIYDDITKLFGHCVSAPEAVARPEPDWAGDSIMVLDLPTRCITCLERVGIETLGQLVNSTIGKLRCIHNFGQLSLFQTIVALDKKGLTLKGQHPSMTEAAYRELNLKSGLTSQVNEPV